MRYCLVFANMILLYLSSIGLVCNMTCMGNLDLIVHCVSDEKLHAGHSHILDSHKCAYHNLHRPGQHWELSLPGKLNNVCHDPGVIFLTTNTEGKRQSVLRWPQIRAGSQCGLKVSPESFCFYLFLYALVQWQQLPACSGLSTGSSAPISVVRDLPYEEIAERSSLCVLIESKVAFSGGIAEHIPVRENQGRIVRVLNIKKVGSIGFTLQSGLIYHIFEG